MRSARYRASWCASGEGRSHASRPRSTPKVQTSMQFSTGLRRGLRIGRCRTMPAASATRVGAAAVPRLHRRSASELGSAQRQVDVAWTGSTSARLHGAAHPPARTLPHQERHVPKHRSRSCAGDGEVEGALSSEPGDVLGVPVTETRVSLTADGIRSAVCGQATIHGTPVPPTRARGAA